MQCTFDRINRFTAPLYALKDLNDSLQLVFSKSSETETYCRAIVLDSAHVSVSFVSWLCNLQGDRDELTLSVRLQSLLTSLQLAKDANDPCTMSVSDNLDIVTLSMDGGDTTVDVRLLDADGESLDAPPMDEVCVMSFDTSRFRDVCRELSLLGDTVTFASDGTTLTLSTRGDIGNATITLRPASVAAAQTVTGVPISLRYLNSVLKSWTVSPRVTLSIRDAMPLCLSLESDDVSLTCYIAPKLDDDMADE